VTEIGEAALGKQQMLVDDEKRRATTVTLKSATLLTQGGPCVFVVVNAAALIWLMSERAIHENLPSGTAQHLPDLRFQIAIKIW